jgi:transposase InsO family protein
LQRAGEAKLRRGRLGKTSGSIKEIGPPCVEVKQANDLWTVDFKGWWKTKDGVRCEPLTVRDAYSRYVLGIDILESNKGPMVRKVFERHFTQYGMPKVIQVDNGTPFISVKARQGLTKLSAWWVALGIKVLRGRPGHPQDNGGHERMHGDMKLDLEMEPAADRKAQQRRCQTWAEEFNHERPHEALGMKVPAELYRKSRRRYQGERQVCYPAHCMTRTVDVSGHIAVGGNKLYVGAGLSGYRVGLQEAAGEKYRVWFYELDMGILG